MKEEVNNLTEQELRNHLITLDYRGKEFKEACLERLLSLYTDEVKINVVKLLDRKSLNI